jgi:hypothetical protein
MIAAANTREKLAVVAVNLVSQADQEVLVSDVTKIARLACTMVVRLVREQISQELVKNLVKKDRVRVLIAQAKVKIEGLVVNRGLNLVKNSQKASQNRGVLGDFPWQF